MNERIIELDSDFEDLLEKLGPETSNPCLFNGEGWVQRISWNPCDSYILDSAAELDKLENFIEYHGSKQHLVAGYISYDLGCELMGLSIKTTARLSLPRAVFFAYDNYLEKSGNEVRAYYKSDDFLAKIAKIDKQEPGPTSVELPGFRSTWNKNQFKTAFEKIHKYIYDGYIYQINLSHELSGESGEDPRKLFTQLSKQNKASMKSYLEGYDFELLSISPERFIRSDGKNIETSPIKGTRPRGIDKKEDTANENSLLNDEKEKAELNMITDLLRNDLGKVCKAGSVKVAKERQLDMLTSVMHTSSLIKGRLKSNIKPMKALLSMLPGGSITGCPKKKAIEIIDQLEQTARGSYCGCMVALDRDGNLDSNILIRTIIKKGTELSLSVGSGIVYDSNMQSEYQETLDKAKPLIGSLD